MQLSRALRLEPGLAVAFVGAGGKTSAIRRVVDEMSSGDMSQLVLITTTTRLGRDQNDLANYHLVDPSADQMAALPELLADHRSVLITGPDFEGKWIPPKDFVFDKLHQIAAQQDALLLIEADGARGKSLKAPAEHEPVIPAFVDLVVPMAGLDVLGETTHSEAVHRPKLVAALVSSRKEIEIGPG